MYVSGIRVSSFLTIMYLWNGKQKTNTHVLLKKKKQYNNVVVLNVQSLFAKEETNKKIVYNCSWTVPISQQKGCAEIEHTLTQKKDHSHRNTSREPVFGPHRFCRNRIGGRFKKKKNKNANEPHRKSNHSHASKINL